MPNWRIAKGPSSACSQSHWIPRSPIPNPWASHQARPPSAGADQDPGGRAAGGAEAQRQDGQRQEQGMRQQPGLAVPQPLEQPRRVVVVPGPAVDQPGGVEDALLDPVPGQEGEPDPADRQPEQQRPARIADPAAARAAFPLPHQCGSELTSSSHFFSSRVRSSAEPYLAKS